MIFPGTDGTTGRRPIYGSERREPPRNVTEAVPEDHGTNDRARNYRYRSFSVPQVWGSAGVVPPRSAQIVRLLSVKGFEQPQVVDQ